MKYIENNSNNPYYNLALEEFVFVNKTDADYILLWQNANTVVVGKNQNTAMEINAEKVRALGVNVVRRMTGGGAVYHDMGNLNFSFITDWTLNDGVNYKRFLNPVIAALQSLGVNAQASGRNDIVADGYKISGNAQALRNGRILHHGTLLIDADLDVVGQVLNVDAGKIESKGLKSVRSRVTNINDCVAEPLSVGAVKEALLKAFTEDAGLEMALLSNEDLAAVSALAKEKYEAWEWNYGKSPGFKFKDQKRFAGGSVQTELDVNKGVITGCKIYGDFLALLPIEDVENTLCGMDYIYDDIKKVLSSMNIQLYLGTVSVDEFLSCLGF